MRWTALVGVLSCVAISPQMSAAQGPLPVVQVALEPELPSEERDSILRSCSSVFASQGPRACDTEGAGEVRTEVSWKTNDSGLQVSIELIKSEGKGRVIRVLSFSDTEDTQARWQAVGLVVAALASAELASQQVQEEPPPPPPPVPVPAAPTSETALILEIGGLIRQESDQEFLSGGGAMRLSWNVGSKWEPTLAVGTLAGTTPVNQVSIKPSFGMGFRIVEDPVALLVRLEGIALATRWSASDPIGRDADSQWHVRYGASLGPVLRVPFSSTIGLIAGLSATTVFPPVELSVRNEVVGTSSVFGGEGNLGLWARF